MLVIRMQRSGRTGHAQFRVIAQDGRFHPGSGRVVAYLGNYDPHTKTATLEKDKIEELIGKGAQPSDRIIKLLKQEGYKLPKWIKEPAKKQKKTKNPEKYSGSATPAAEPVNKDAAEPAQEAAAEEAPAKPAAPAEDSPAEPEPAAEPAEPEEPAVESAEATAEEPKDQAAAAEDKPAP